ncbi:hypothetical protein ASG92_22300 [Arthrobacter sp. Soil736]|uniref:hypothetical protein n=1 Tax=Arthrobacter sp. Soil736 TaxID=1736395 RepID=UPI0006F815E1|nr:hypothetical protein [Arthrobacter sp. Soil736]KRE60018.1 hypothetical protein ASG92_22300 [Arthrobacter sp. Soil736]
MSDDQSREQHEGQTNFGHGRDGHNHNGHGRECHDDPDVRDPDDPDVRDPDDQHAREQEDKAPEPNQKDCRCDSSTIDTHLCKSEGLAREADFASKQKTDIDSTIQSYTKVRKEYPNLRKELLPQVNEITEQLERVQERIRCAMPKNTTAKRLDEAFEAILRTVEKCAGSLPTCVVEPCDFDLDVRGLELVGARRKLAEYEGKMATYRKCMLELLEEPTNLSARLAASVAAVKTLAEALAADPDADKLKQLYVEARVAERDVKLIWSGYNSASEYVDRLCLTLDCWLAAVDMATILTGRLGVLECRERSAAKRCKEMADNIVGETVMRYERDRAAGVRPAESDGTQSEPDFADDVAIR